MKPGKPLERRTPLARGTSQLARTTPLKPVSAKQAKRQREYRKVLTAHRASNDVVVCEFPQCTVAAVDNHHGRGRVGVDLFDTSAFHDLCRPHHRWVGEHPLKAIALRLSAPRLGRRAA